jgi:hypothetical protein
MRQQFVRDQTMVALLTSVLPETRRSQKVETTAWLLLLARQLLPFQATYHPPELFWLAAEAVEAPTVEVEVEVEKSATQAPLQ